MGAEGRHTAWEVVATENMTRVHVPKAAPGWGAARLLAYCYIGFETYFQSLKNTKKKVIDGIGNQASRATVERTRRADRHGPVPVCTLGTLGGTSQTLIYNQARAKSVK